MKRLLIYLKDYRKESILAPLFKMLEASFELFVPLVMAAIMDVGIAGKDMPYIWKMAGILLLLAVIGLTCSLTAQYFAAKAAVGFSAKLKHALFQHIQNFSFSEIDEAGTSTLITRMTSDMNQVQNGVNMVLRLFLRSPFIVFGAMIMAFTIDWKAALIFVVAIPLLSVVVFGIMLISIPRFRKVQEGLDKVLGITRENLTGVRVIRAFNQEEEERSRFHRNNEDLTRLQLVVGRISAFMNPVTFIIVNAAVMALIWTGAIQVDTGVLTQGEVVALINYMNQILVELVKLANLIITITKAVACGNRIQSIFELETSQSFPEEPVEENTSGEIIVDFQDVSFTYKNAGDAALRCLNLQVRRGETIGIIGGTGSGKTTFVHLLPRFYDATKGQVLIDGVDVRSYPKEQLRNKIGIVMQKAVLFKGSIRENLLWGNAEAEDAVLYKALETAQALEVVRQKDGELDAMISQGGKNLSGGQRQRLTIARALVREPEILILDDSTSALDYATDAKLRKALQEMEQRPTIFIVSQRTASIQHADRIVVLDDGEAVGIGTHEELLKDCEVYQEIYHSQFKKEAQGA
ncbi:MAG: ABC transporter ATP-binding protein/permease [Bacteroides sp.]|nr:ABC transporter ATP-binding protein/permease [Bacteroides sp.]MCM1550618.1 ABC transporter ATP-binding protein/permease [Clostridium sp.]